MLFLGSGQVCLFTQDLEDPCTVFLKRHEEKHCPTRGLQSEWKPRGAVGKLHLSLFQDSYLQGKSHESTPGSPGAKARQTKAFPPVMAATGLAPAGGFPGPGLPRTTPPQGVPSWGHAFPGPRLPRVYLPGTQVRRQNPSKDAAWHCQQLHA